MRVVQTSKHSPSLKNGQGLVLSDPPLNIPYPISTGEELFGQRNTQQSFEPKGLRKYHHKIVNPITIRSAQADTIPHLYSSSWGNVIYQPETSTKRLYMVLPLYAQPPPQRFLGGWEEKQGSIHNNYEL